VAQGFTQDKDTDLDERVEIVSFGNFRKEMKLGGLVRGAVGPFGQHLARFGLMVWLHRSLPFFSFLSFFF